jgi:predicted DNA-binding helix-hairpin-helix protein
MDLSEKLALLMSLAIDDRDGDERPLPPRLRNSENLGALGPLNIRDVRMRTGGRTSLLRVLMTNACSLNCHYCPMRRDRELPRTLLKPEELVRIFLAARRRKWCDGLFITTGIPGRPVKVMDDLITVLELLRDKHRFAGYIHVKMIAGGEAAQIERLVSLASRVSLNLEAPCGANLARVAPEKNLATSLESLNLARAQVARGWREEADGRPRDRLHPGGTAGMTMQFVVGATPDPDSAILGKVTELYALRGVHHAHFSAFRPIRDTPMEEKQATPVVRERRLYQADYLLRQYGYRPEEIVFEKDGNLPLGMDPKVAWALAHPEHFPVEVRTAPYEALVRVPGIGPGTARHLIKIRPATVFRGITDLRRAGVRTAYAAGFLTLGGRRLHGLRWTEQLGFWKPEEETGAYHMIYEVSPGTFR